MPITVQQSTASVSTVSAGPVLRGSDLIDMLKSSLGNYQNAFDQTTMLRFLNEGKDEVWSILKSLNEDYFLGYSQSATANQNDYFPVLASNQREYDLPPEFRHMKFIEVMGPTGKEFTRFVYRDMTTRVFQDARNNSTAYGPMTLDTYYYDIVGKSTLVLAQYPETALTIRLWYIREIFDFTELDQIQDVLLPYNKKVVDWAAKKCMLSVQDDAEYATWVAEWRNSVISLINSASHRQMSDAEFVEGFQE